MRPINSTNAHICNSSNIHALQKRMILPGPITASYHKTRSKRNNFAPESNDVYLLIPARGYLSHRKGSSTFPMCLAIDVVAASVGSRRVHPARRLAAPGQPRERTNTAEGLQQARFRDAGGGWRRQTDR